MLTSHQSKEAMSYEEQESKMSATVFSQRS